jgi:hypothetical protein
MQVFGTLKVKAEWMKIATNAAISCFIIKLKKKLNSMIWVRERTIPTERPPLVGEVISNLCG